MNDKLKAALVERAKREQARRVATSQAQDGWTPITPQTPEEAAARENQIIAAGEAPMPLLGGLARGGTFGFSDEIAAGAETLARGGNFQDNLDRTRAAEASAKDAAPGAFLGGEIMGAVTSTAGAAPYAVGKSLLGTALRGMGIGAAEGTLYGAGTGEGVKGRVEGAAETAVLGGILGAAFPFATSGIKNAYRAVSNPIASALNLGNAGRAERAIASTVRGSGKTLDDITADVAAAAADGQPQFRTVDALGRSGQRRASGIVRAGGDTADEMGDFLANRQAAQGERVSEFVEDAFDLRNTTAQKAQETVKKNRKKVADELFDKAAKDAKPVDVRGAVSMLDDTLSKLDNVNIKRPPEVAREFKRWRGELAGTIIKTDAATGVKKGDPAFVSDYESVLTTWRSMRDRIDELYKSSGGSVAEALKPIRDSLQSALEESSDLYRSATDLYRVGSGVVDAFDDGAQMATRGRARDNVASFANKTAQEQRAARMGYGDKVLDQLERNASPTANKAKPLTSPKRSTEAQAVASDPELLARRLNREGTMWATQNRALGGSRTADNLADMEGAERLAAGTGGILRSAANFQLGDAISNAAAVVAPRLTGQNEATRNLIAKALMSSDVGILAKALKRQARESVQIRAVDGILRNAARIGYESAN